MKSFIIFCSSSILLYQITRYNKFLKKKNKNKNKKIDGIIFGETGVNFAYQLGITKYIQENYNLDNYKFCGISGGCHCAFILSNKIEVDDFYNQFIIQTFNQKNQNKYSSIFDIANIALYKLYKSIFNLENINDKMYISITKVFPTFSNHTVSKFKDFNDAFLSIKSSQYIPFLFGSSYTVYNNQVCIDGYLSSFNYKPTNENWVKINISDFSSYYYLTCILNFTELFNEDYHKKCYSDGYNDAKKYNKYFIDMGFKSK